VKNAALVTGAARGIGAAVAEALARQGRPLLLNFLRNEAAARSVQARIEAAGGHALLCPFDVRDGEQTRGALAALLDAGWEIDVLVNNAGVARDQAFPALSAEAWQEVTRTSLDGFFHVTQPLVMPMVSRRRGRIINIASISGLVGNRGQTNYSAAKAGLIGATRSLALELAKRKITVNAVAPGLIETDMLDKAPVDALRKAIPMQRLGQPEEVAALVAFLASDQAAYITGQVIGINGGLA